MRKLIFITTLIFVSLSCRKQDASEFEGPDINDLFGPFFITKDITLSAKTINFALDGDLFLYGELSKNTSWSIKFTGSQTGAERTINGFGRVINTSWEGGANTFPAFGLEKVYMKITFPTEDQQEAIPVIDSINVTGRKPDIGYLITDFESGVGARWGATFANSPYSINCSDGQSAIGDCYAGWDGTVTWDWGIGSIIVRPDVAGPFNLPNTANNLYFNMAVNFEQNTGTRQCAMILSFQEDEDGDGKFNPATEDAYGYEYWYEQTEKPGWNLMSVKYGDLQFDANGNKVNVNGNGLPEPSKIVGIDVIYIANPAGGNAKASVDHLIFTTNEPYRP